MVIQRYQLVLLGPEKEHYRAAIEAKVSELFEAVGLDFSRDGEILVGASTEPDWSGFPVALWFGGTGTQSADELETMREFLVRGFTLFPIVDDLGKYSSKVPHELHPINGQIWNDARVVADVMKGFRLVRKFRQAFISYRRSESSGVAHQLFHELNERGFRVFLDSASVEAGVDFQKALWSRMADVDLIVLLDSPGALDSTWVYQELNRAHDLGLGVVQLIWPGHKQTKGTELSLPIQLEVEDYEGRRCDKADVLTEETLQKIMRAVESERIRSLSARRTRLVEGLLDHVSSCGGVIYVHPMRYVDVFKGESKIAEIVPFVGVPDSLSVFQYEAAKTHEPTIVIYNGLGVDQEWAEHLRWLNAKSSVTVHQIDDFGDYIKRVT